MLIDIAAKLNETARYYNGSKAAREYDALFIELCRALNEYKEELEARELRRMYDAWDRLDWEQADQAQAQAGG